MDQEITVCLLYLGKIAHKTMVKPLYLAERTFFFVVDSLLDLQMGISKPALFGRTTQHQLTRYKVNSLAIVWVINSSLELNPVITSRGSVCNTCLSSHSDGIYFPLHWHLVHGTAHLTCKLCMFSLNSSITWAIFSAFLKVRFTCDNNCVWLQSSLIAYTNVS